MNNWQIAVDSTDSAINSVNSSMSEQERYSQSLEARINRLGNAWTEFSSAVGDAVLTDSLILVVEGLRDITKAGSGVVDTVGVLPIVFGVANTSLLLLSKNFRTFSTAALFGTKAVNGTALATVGLETNMKRATIATTGLKVALRGLASATIVGGAFVILGILLEKIISGFADSQEKMEEFEKSQQKNIDALTSQKSKTDELISSYKKLSQERESGNWDNEKEQEYLKIQQELATVFPALIDHIDAQGNSHLVNVDRIEEEVKATKELIEAKKEEIRLNAQDNIRGLIKDRNKIQNRISSKEERKQMFDNFAKDLPNWWFGQKEEAQQESAKIKTEIIGLEREYSNASQRINDEVLKIADAFNDIEIDPSLKKEISDVVSSMDFSQMDESQLENVAKNVSSNMQDIQKSLTKGSQDAVDKSVESFNKYTDKISNSNPLVKDLKISIDELTKAQQMNGVITDESSDSIDENTEEYKGFSKELDDIYSKLSAVNKILEDYKENNSLSAESIDEILDVYPQLLAYVNDEEQMIKQLETLRNQDAENAKQIMQQKIQDSTDFYDVNRQMIETHINNLNLGYDVDLDNFKSLAEAKLGIEKQLIVNLAMAWKKYLQGRDIGNAWGTLGTFRKDGVYELTQAGRDYFVKGGRMDELTWLSQQQQTTNAQIKEMEDTINSISNVSADFTKVGTKSSSSSKSKSGSKSKDDKPQIEDTTDAIISQINAESRLAESKNATTKEQLDEITAQQKYREQINLTNKLISGQEEQINKLKLANTNLSKEADKVRASTKYDTSKWFDDQTQATQQYMNLYNSLKTGTAQEELQKVFDKLQKLKTAWGQNAESIKDLTKSTKEYSQELNNLQLTAMKSEYDQQLDDIDFLIQKHQLLNADLEEGSKAYEQALSEQTALINQKIALTEQEIQKTLDLMAVQQADSLIMGELKERYEDLVIAQLQYQQELSNLKREITGKQKDLANEIIDIIKDTYRKQEEVALDSIEREMDALEEAHDEKIKMLDEQISKIEEYIRAKLKQIDTDESERDFTKELQKLQKERQKIQDQINKLSMDDTRETQVKVMQLEEEKAKLTEQIDELSHDRQIELRKENLQDQLDSYKKDYDNKKSIEDDKFQKEKKRLDDIRKETQRHYENLINDERRFAQIRESIMDGNLSSIKNMLSDFEDFIGDNMSTIGESISENLIDRINDARAEIERLNELEREYDRASSSSKSSSSSSKSSGSSKSSSGSSSNKNPITTLSESSSLGGFKLVGSTATAWVRQLVGAIGGDTGDIDFDEKRNKVTYDGKTFDVMYNNSGRAYVGIKEFMRKFGHDVEWDEKARKVSIFHKGGKIGDVNNKDSDFINSLFNVKPNEQIIKALKGEVVVNPAIAMPNFRNNISNLVNSVAPRQSQSGGNKIEIKEFIRIDNVTKDVNVDQFIDKAMDRFTQKLKPFGFTF